MSREQYRVLFVCMGNICRSPTAEGMFLKKISDAGYSDKFEADSCGTHQYHLGHAPDFRTQEAAKNRGIDLSKLRARKIDYSDFEDFDLILVMDKLNQRNIFDFCPDQYKNKIKLMLDYLPDETLEEVPDPYYGGEQGFEIVLDILDKATEALIKDLT